MLLQAAGVLEGVPARSVLPTLWSLPYRTAIDVKAWRTLLGVHVTRIIVNGGGTAPALGLASSAPTPLVARGATHISSATTAAITTIAVIAISTFNRLCLVHDQETFWAMGTRAL